MITWSDLFMALGLLVVGIVGLLIVFIIIMLIALKVSGQEFNPKYGWYNKRKIDQTKKEK